MLQEQLRINMDHFLDFLLLLGTTKR